MKDKYPNLIKALSELELIEVPSNTKQRVLNLLKGKTNGNTRNRRYT